MTSPLDEKGLRAAMEAQVGQGCAVREYIDFTAEDAKSFGVNIVGENFAKLDVVRHQQYEDAGLAILSAAIRAYLSATPAPDGMEVIAYLVKDDPELGDYLTKSRQAAERSDYGHVRLTDADQAQSALAAMRAEQTRVSMGWADTLNALETAEAEVKRLTEELAAIKGAPDACGLCGWKDRALKADARVEAAEQQVRDMRDGLEPFVEFAKVRDDNDPDMPDRMVVAAYATDLRGNAVRITLGDLRRARLLIEEDGK